MKKIHLLTLFLLAFFYAQAQDYIKRGDSCYTAKDYVCAANNYDLFLEKVESRSNMIAYRSAKSWSLAGNRERAIAAVKKYVANNYENNYMIFSDRLIKEKAFDLIKDDLQWKTVIVEVQAKELEVTLKEKKKVDSTLAIQHQIEKDAVLTKLNFNYDNAQTAYQKIKKYNRYPAISEKYLSLQFQITDSSHTAFLVVMPPNYNPKKPYPLLFFLHGAVSSNSGYLDLVEPSWDTGGWNRFYTKYAGEVIMVYPHGGKDYNWMYPDRGFFMVPAILRQIKQIINVDDDRVFISGHSNGATGSFSYAMKQPTPFAGFYGFNTRPHVATGGTYIRNILNRSFFNVSVDQDYYYPPAANDSLNAVMKKLKADYQDHRYNGFPHWFPQFNESEPAYKLLFADLGKRKRDPFRPYITWECDNVKYGRCDWVSITALDTVALKANWQTNINFKINEWIILDKENKPIVRDTLINAFNYVKRSGAIKATYASNTFDIHTSAVKSIRLYLSPEMIDLKNPVVVIVNGKTYFKSKLGYNKQFMLDEFKDTIDRKAIWVNYIDVNLSKNNIVK